MRSDFSRYEVDIETLKNWCAYEKSFMYLMSIHVELCMAGTYIEQLAKCSN